MKSDDRHLVSAALELQGVEQQQAVEAFATAEALHQFALHYNPNDGLLPYLTIVEHQLCDAGTALYIYWQLPDHVFDPVLRATSQDEGPDWNGSAILDAVERRFREGFVTANYYFDPIGYHQLNVAQRRMLEKQGTPQYLLESIGTLRVDRESL